MSYRQSSYDPTAYDRPGRPLRPYNRVQWIGVVLFGIGILLLLISLGALIGVPMLKGVRTLPAIAPILVGQMLIFSRRESLGPVDDALQRARNRRALALTVAACALILGAAAVIQFSGA